MSRIQQLLKNHIPLLTAKERRAHDTLPIRTITAESMTIEDVHTVLECDAIKESEFDPEHSVKVSKKYLEEFINKYGFSELVAIDMLQHYIGVEGLGDDPFDVEAPYEIFYEHFKSDYEAELRAHGRK